MMPTRFGLIGCGRIGRMHARNIAAHPMAQLIVCHDLMADASEACASEVGAQTAPSVDALLGADIDAVFIASATDTHVDLITRSVQVGKAVLCEKPVDLDMRRVEACEREIGRLADRVMLGFNRRFDKSFGALRKRLLDGEIGRLEQMVITSRDPAPPPPQFIASSGGLFRDLTIHDFDMARYLAGDIVEVQAMGANLIDPAIEAAGDIDAAMVIMRAASGALVHINNSRRCAYGYDQRIEAFGSGGMLQAQNQHPTTVEAWTAEHTHAQDRVPNFFIDRYAEAYRAEIGHFVECLASGKPFLAGFAEGKAALQLADAALASLASGRAETVGHTG
jgi:myo-inositol 2-dehydrogenase/D-chiro-inositol 1-dehydrogenase